MGATEKMWRFALSITLLAVVAGSLELQDPDQGFLDEKLDAVVIEAKHEESQLPRSGRQFSWSTGMFRGQFPASTMPLVPVAQTGNYLCFTPSGQMKLCGRQFGGGWPGAGSQWPGAGVQQPGWPGGGGQQPGWPGAGGQQPPQQGGWPGAGGQQPGWPGAGGQQPPPQDQGPPPGISRPDPNAPVPATEKPAPPQGPPGPGSAYPKTCGVGKYFPIRYNSEGVVAEEQERLEYDHQHPFKVVNGWPADQGEWPWIAALLQNGRQFCGGSLISKKHILTAAHCVAHMSRQDVAGLKVRLGDHAIRQTGETNIFESKAARVVRHKEFTQQTLHKDVAIITLEDEVPEMENVRAVCLPSGNDDYAGKTGTVVGWGSIKEQGPQPDVLREVTVRIWDNPTCKDTYGNAAPGGIMDHMLCAGQKGKDSCSGDSGGPMSIGTGPTWTQIGIVSWGIGCGKSHYPGVYTRVTAVKSWIDKIVKDY